MKRSFLKLVVGSLFLVSPLAALAADVPAPAARQVLLITSDEANASITGQPAMNAAFTKEVEDFTSKLKSLLEGSGHVTTTKNTSNIALTRPGNPLAIAVASLLPNQVSHIGSTYWGPDASGNIMINVDFYTVIYKDTKGSIQMGDKNFGKKMLFLAAGSGVPASTAEKLATDFHAHLAATAFKQ